MRQKEDRLTGLQANLDTLFAQLRNTERAHARTQGLGPQTSSHSCIFLQQSFFFETYFMLLDTNKLCAQYSKEKRLF